MLVWYNNNGYTDNEVFDYLTDYPGFGPKGRMLVVDANPDRTAIRTMLWETFPNEGANISHPWTDARRTIHPGRYHPIPHTPIPTVRGANEHSYEGRPAVSSLPRLHGVLPRRQVRDRQLPDIPRGPPPVDPPNKWDASAVVPDHNGLCPSTHPATQVGSGCASAVHPRELELRSFTLCSLFPGLGL